MVNQKQEHPKTNSIKRAFNYILENAEWGIPILMIGFMTAGAAAFWLYFAIENGGDIIAGLFAANIVVTLVLNFAGVFKRKNAIIVIIVLLALASAIVIYIKFFY